jgi:predicted  nucleic acid-binding Zn-ribbon protein
MEKLREWLRGGIPMPGSSKPAGKRPDTQESRDSRADRIRNLQAEVSRLQQQRLELSNTAGTVPDSTEAISREMESSERALETAQQELSKLQARI